MFKFVYINATLMVMPHVNNPKFPQDIPAPKLLTPILRSYFTIKLEFELGMGESRTVFSTFPHLPSSVVFTFSVSNLVPSSALPSAPSTTIGP